MTVKFSVEDQVVARSLSKKLRPRQRKGEQHNLHARKVFKGKFILNNNNEVSNEK